MPSTTLISNSEASKLIYEKLDLGGDVSFHVQGHSMKPFFHPGKTLVTVKKLGRPIKKYDVVLFHTPNLPMVLHRVIKITSSAIYTQGDALFDYEKIPPYAIHGVVIWHEYKGKLTTATDICYRINVRLWVLIRPLRYLVRRILHRWRT